MTENPDGTVAPAPGADLTDPAAGAVERTVADAVTITSVGGQFTAPEVAVYGATKFTATATTEAWRQEYTKRDPRFSVIEPGRITVNEVVIRPTDQAWSTVLDVITGQLLGMRAAMPALLASGERAAIVNMASLYANIGSPSSIFCHASKGGVRSMTKSAAVERVFLVVPGGDDEHRSYTGPDPRSCEVLPPTLARFDQESR